MTDKYRGSYLDKLKTHYAVGDEYDTLCDRRVSKFMREDDESKVTCKVCLRRLEKRSS